MTKKAKKKTKLVTVKNITGKNILGYNVIYKPGDTFQIELETAKKLSAQNRVEILKDADDNEQTQTT